MMSENELSEDGVTGHTGSVSGQQRVAGKQPAGADGRPGAAGGLPAVVLALQKTTHHTLHALSAALADLSINAAEINALANLGDGGIVSVRQLSDRTGTRASTLTGVLDRLENRGYLTRELDPADRRSFRLPLTEAGQAVADRVLAAVANLEREALGRLSATQLAGYHAVITALQEAC
jgi:MarR family transcriptional regulator, organic hydroperoxide resistance regulator